jgi:hypothetical protein
MRSINFKRLLSVVLIAIAFGCQTVMGQENETQEFNRISFGVGWKQKQILPKGILSSVINCVTDGFYGNVGVDFSVHELPVGLGGSVALHHDFYVNKEKSLKDKMTIWSVPIEVHVMCLFRIPQSKVRVMPLIGVGVEHMLSWEEKMTEDGVSKEYDLLEDKRFSFKENLLFWHVGAEVFINNHIGLKLSYQRYFGSIDEKEVFKSNQLSIGLNYSFNF